VLASALGRRGHTFSLKALVAPGSRKEHRSPTNPFVMLYGVLELLQDKGPLGAYAPNRQAWARHELPKGLAVFASPNFAKSEGGTPRRRGATRKASSTAQPRQGRGLTADGDFDADHGLAFDGVGNPWY
jgi:hypothetical protein